MDTAIGYLDLVREDLLEAGLRERRRRGRRPSGLRDRFSTRQLVGAAAAVTLLAAGTVGWFVTDGGFGVLRTQRFATPASEGGADAATGATGATADEQFGYLDDVPAASPAPMPHEQGVDAAITGGVSRVIRTAQIGLVIPPDSFDDRFADVVSIASANGGFVETSTTRERSGNVTMRVPADAFDETMRELRSLGEVEVQTVQGQDVTADYVDLRARFRIARARRDVLLRLMDRATSIEQTIRVQNALDDTQLRIEQLQGQLRLLDDRVSLAAIELRLREEGVDVAEEVDTPSIPNAFERSVAGFVGVIAGMVVGLGYVIPIVAIGLLAWFVVTRIRRRRSA